MKKQLNQIKKGFLFASAAVLALSSCKTESSSEENVSTSPAAPAAALKSEYCLAHHMSLSVTNGTYQVRAAELGPDPLDMTGTYENGVLSLSAERDGMQFIFIAGVAQGGSILAASMTVLDENGYPRVGLKSMGVEGACSTTDLDSLPKIASNPVNLSEISRISRYRSSSGHNYSDGSESCRSMKHYFEPVSTADRTAAVYAPINAIVVAVYNDDGPVGDDGVTNQHIALKSLDHPAIEVDIFHTELSSDLVIGSIVSAGDMLGWGDLSRNGGIASNFDFAVHVNTADGRRNASLFDIMTDEAFAEYTAWSGAATRDDFKISKTDRDAHPLQCEAGPFPLSGEFIDPQNDALINQTWVDAL